MVVVGATTERLDEPKKKEPGATILKSSSPSIPLQINY